MADDYTDNTSTRGIVSPGGKATGIFDNANDSDWFKIVLTANNFYTFELTSTSPNTYFRSLYFYDSQGNYISSSTSGGSLVKATLKAASSGTYYVAAREQDYSSSYTAAPYTVKASAGVADDIGDTRAVAKVLTLGQKTSAVLESGSDIDYFRISVQAGITYTITPNWNPDGTSNGSGSMRVEDPNGAGINVYNSSGPTSFTATLTGDYYLAASTSYSSGTNYNITVSKTVDDHAANKAGAGQLILGAAATSGTLEVQGDRDWYGVQLSAGTTYWFTLGAGTSSPAYYGSGGMLKLIAEDGTVVATSSGYTYIDSSTPMLLQYAPAAGGKYYLEISDSYYTSGKYQVRAVVGEKDDYGDTQATAADVAVGSPVQGKLAIPQDSDVFKLSVTAGKTYLVALTGQALTGGDALSLSGRAADYSSNASLFEFARQGVAEYRVLTADTTGDYYFTISNNSSRGTGGYTLSVSEPLVDDYASGKSTSGELTVGGKATGVLDYTGDTDAFKVTLQNGAKYAFQLHGAGSGEGSLALGYVQLRITSPDQSGAGYLTDNKDGTYTFTSGIAGDYYISVSPDTSYYNSTATDMTGSYTLHAMALSGDTTGAALVSRSPAMNVAPLDNITLRFNETIMRGGNSSNELITLRDSTGVALETYYGGDSRITINGSTLTIDPTMQLKPGTQYLLSVPTGAVLDLAGNKLASTELLPIETLRTVTAGGAGNDYLVGLGIGLKVSGGAGVDTVIYGYNRGNYDVGRTTTGATVVEKYSSSTSADVLDGVERLLFSNASVALDIDGTGGQAYRLYQAAFDRTPDSTGLGYWMKQMDNGMSLLDVSREFLKSDEFTRLYGASLSDSAFVTKLYQNVLDRAPDQAGFDNWVNALGSGTERASVLRDFSESNENQATLLKVIGNGFEYTPYG